MATKYLFSAMKARTGDPTAKLILIYLADASNDNGFCWPAHSTIADGCECSVSTVQRKVDSLIEMGFINYENRSQKGFKTSNMYKLIEPDLIGLDGKPKIGQSDLSTIGQSDRTDQSNRPIEPTYSLPIKHTKGKFTIPTVQQVEEYISTRTVKIDAERFHAHYTANGWKVGRVAMKDWQAAVRYWEKGNNGHTKNTTGKPEHQRKLSGAERTRAAREEAYRRLERLSGSPDMGSLEPDQVGLPI